MINEKKEYLKRYKNLNVLIDSLSEEILTLRTKAEGFSHIISDTTKSNTQGNGMENTMAKKSEIEEKLCHLTAELMTIRLNIETALESLKNDTYRTLLQLHYINGYTWEQVAEKMNYNGRWVMRMHIKALENLAIESHA